LEDVQVDWQELASRAGLKADPGVLEKTVGGRRAARFFTNVFYSWTSRDLVPRL